MEGILVVDDSKFQRFCIPAFLVVGGNILTIGAWTEIRNDFSKGVIISVRRDRQTSHYLENETQFTLSLPSPGQLKELCKFGSVSAKKVGRWTKLKEIGYSTFGGFVVPDNVEFTYMCIIESRMVSMNHDIIVGKVRYEKGSIKSVFLNLHGKYKQVEI